LQESHLEHGIVCAADFMMLLLWHWWQCHLYCILPCWVVAWCCRLHFMHVFLTLNKIGLADNIRITTDH